MRFLHLSDLHLGKQMNDVSLLEDQRCILDQIIAIAKTEKVEAVLIAGDVYQRSAPQAEAMTLFDGFLTKLKEMSLPVLVISGNHDSAQRISYFSSLLKASDVYMSETFTGQMQKVTLLDQEGDIHIWMLPYLRPGQVKQLLPQEKITNCQEAVEAVLRNTPINPKARNVLLAHQFVAGSVTSDSEDLTIGTLDAVMPETFNAFDYVALGHIHKPQHILRNTLRYAGSPLKYSFSEAAHRKSVTIVEMAEKGNVKIHTVPLYPLHDVRLLEGKTDELMNLPYSEDYLWITVHDETVPPDIRQTLAVNFPNMMKFSVVNSKTKYDHIVTATAAMENKSVLELFCDFYRLQNNDQEPDEARLSALQKIIDSIGGDEA